MASIKDVAERLIPFLFATPAIGIFMVVMVMAFAKEIPIVMMVVVIMIAVARMGLSIEIIVCDRAGDQSLQLPMIQPNAPALPADIDCDAIPVPFFEYGAFTAWTFHSGPP